MSTFGGVSSLVGGWTNPSEKYERQIGSFPQVGVKIPKILKKPPPRKEIKPFQRLTPHLSTPHVKFRGSIFYFIPCAKAEFVIPPVNCDPRFRWCSLVASWHAWSHLLQHISVGEIWDFQTSGYWWRFSNPIPNHLGYWDMYKNLINNGRNDLHIWILVGR